METETIADKFGRLMTSLKNIRAAIIAKNPSVMPNGELDTWADAINSLPANPDVPPEDEFSWEVKPLTGSISDIVSEGVMAQIRNSSGQLKDLSGAKSFGTVGSVTFGGSYNGDGGMISSPPQSWNGHDFGEAATCGVEGQYGQILKHAFDTGGSYGTYTFTFHGLDPAKKYLVQYIIHGTDAGHQASVTDNDVVKTIELGSSDPTSQWYYGGTLIRRFVPEEDGTYQLQITFTKNGSPANALMNAFQVREIS